MKAAKDSCVFVSLYLLSTVVLSWNLFFHSKEKNFSIEELCSTQRRPLCLWCILNDL